MTKSKNKKEKELDLYSEEFLKDEIDINNLSLDEIIEEKKNLKKIIKSKIIFNSMIYLLPGLTDKSLSRYIIKNDFIYKSVIGDLFTDYFSSELDQELETVILTPLQIYLREAKHFFNLTVFKALIKTKEKEDLSYLKLKLYDDIFFLYGGLHIIAVNEVKIILDGTRTVNLSRANINSEGSNIYIDIFNIYNDNEKNNEVNKRINNIEKYLAYSTRDRFQIFISGALNNPTMDNDNLNYNFQKYVSNLINFDTKSMYYEAKSIVLSSENFIVIPTFFENISFKNCTHFEIAFDYKEEKISFEEQEEIEKDEENEIQNIFDETKISSFDVKIATLLDLNSS